MVAYSFHRRFVAPIQAGLGLVAPVIVRPKRQTIRGNRKRHARPGEEVQLYTAMRAKYCELIGRATCAEVVPITLFFGDRFDEAIVDSCPVHDFDDFARADGFQSWAGLKAFWRERHPGVDEFSGVLIRWEGRERR